MTFRTLAASLIIAGAVLAGGTVAVDRRAAAREAAAEAAYPPEGDFVAVAGRRVHAVVRGDGPDLVLIHGLSGNARDFTFALADILAARYRVIVFDRPGLGWSDALPAGGDGLAAQARHLQQAAAMLGAERPIVVGQSYGGAVAIAWALDHPGQVAALVTLSAPSHVWEGGMSAFYRVTAHPVGAAVAVPVITALVPARTVSDAVAGVFHPQAMPPGYADHLGPELTLRRETLRANARHRARLKADIAGMQPRYGTLTLPVEILHGDADTTVSYTIHAEAMVRDAPDARLTRLSGIGHMPHHVAMPEVIAAIDRAAARAGLR